MREGRSHLAKAGIETPDLDAALLLGHILGRTRLDLQTDPILPNETQRETFRKAIAERSRGVPVAYLTGHREFWGLEILCDRRALVPRPETELLVEKALEEGRSLSQIKYGEKLRVLDLCSGTGCVGLALATEEPTWEIYLADVSPDALDLALENAQRILGKNHPLVVLRSDLFSEVPGFWDLVVANPPYLSPGEATACLARGWEEPLLALDGGGDGSNLLLRLVAEAENRVNKGGVLFLEAAVGVRGPLEAAFACPAWQALGPWKDLAGLWRVWGGRRI